MSEDYTILQIAVKCLAAKEDLAASLGDKGSAPALVDVVSGQVQMMIDTISTVAPYAKDNRLRPLAIAIARRSALLPDVPTLEEAASLPGFEMSAWQGIVVPAATPTAWAPPS